MKNRLVKLFICCLFVQYSGHAQNYKQDIYSVNKTLLSMNNYSMQLNYKMFLDNETSKPFQQRTVKLIRQNKNLSMNQNNELEVIEMEKYHVYLDHKDKLFTVIEKDKEEKDLRNETLKLLETYLDSIANVCEKINVIYNDEQTVKYECILKPNENVTTILVEIDKKLKFYKSITTKYKQPTQVRELNNESHYLTLRVEYSGLRPDPHVSPSIFNASNYIAFKNNKVAGPSSRYNKYRYFNNPN